MEDLTRHSLKPPPDTAVKSWPKASHDLEPHVPPKVLKTIPFGISRNAGSRETAPDTISREKSVSRGINNGRKSGTDSLSGVPNVI